MKAKILITLILIILKIQGQVVYTESQIDSSIILDSSTDTPDFTDLNTDDNTATCVQYYLGLYMDFGDDFSIHINFTNTQNSITLLYDKSSTNVNQFRRYEIYIDANYDLVFDYYGIYIGDSQWQMKGTIPLNQGEQYDIFIATSESYTYVSVYINGYFITKVHEENVRSIDYSSDASTRVMSGYSNMSCTAKLEIQFKYFNQSILDINNVGYASNKDYKIQAEHYIYTTSKVDFMIDKQQEYFDYSKCIFFSPMINTAFDFTDKFFVTQNNNNQDQYKTLSSSIYDTELAITSQIVHKALIPGNVQINQNNFSVLIIIKPENIERTQQSLILQYNSDSQIIYQVFLETNLKVTFKIFHNDGSNSSMTSLHSLQDSKWQSILILVDFQNNVVKQFLNFVINNKTILNKTYNIDFSSEDNYIKIGDSELQSSIEEIKIFNDFLPNSVQFNQLSDKFYLLKQETKPFFSVPSSSDQIFQFLTKNAFSDLTGNSQQLLENNDQLTVKDKVIQINDPEYGLQIIPIQEDKTIFNGSYTLVLEIKPAVSDEKQLIFSKISPDNSHGFYIEIDQVQKLIILTVESLDDPSISTPNEKTEMIITITEPSLTTEKNQFLLIIISATTNNDGIYDYQMQINEKQQLDMSFNTHNKIDNIGNIVLKESMEIKQFAMFDKPMNYEEMVEMQLEFKTKYDLLPTPEEIIKKEAQINKAKNQSKQADSSFVIIIIISLVTIVSIALIVVCIQKFKKKKLSKLEIEANIQELAKQQNNKQNDYSQTQLNNNEKQQNNYDFNNQNTQQQNNNKEQTYNPYPYSNYQQPQPSYPINNPMVGGINPEQGMYQQQNNAVVYQENSQQLQGSSNKLDNVYQQDNNLPVNPMQFQVVNTDGKQDSNNNNFVINFSKQDDNQTQNPLFSLQNAEKQMQKVKSNVVNIASNIPQQKIFTISK